MAHPVIEAQDALKAILAARPAFSGVDIRDGGPTEGEDITSSAFWFNDVVIPEDGWAALGASRRRAQFNLGFTLMIRTYGDDERTTRATALDLYEDLQLAVKENPNLGVPASIETTGAVNGTLSTAPISPQEWGSWFTGALPCTSRAY